MLVKAYYIFCLCFLALLLNAKSQPSLSSSQMIGAVQVYRDLKKANLYYYMPFDYRLVTDATGKPDLSLIQMRYTGTKATGDEGAAKYNNLLQFRIAIDLSQNKKIAELKTALKKSSPSAELALMPIRKFSSVLVFAGIAGSENTDSVHLVKAGYAEAIDENAPDNNSYWNDRIVTLRLNDFDAQLVESALRNHQSVMSFSYAIYTVFSETGVNDLNVSGNSPLRKEITKFFEEEIDNQKDSATHITLIKADAIDLGIDAGQWPQAIQKVDINERVPVRYPLFDVYCYDFNNDLRPDLYMKKIEIKATSVNGSEVLTDFSFRARQPDIYAKSIRFAYAVRFDKPFYYRVTEISKEGEVTTTGWKQKKEWSELLDITSTPDTVIVKPVESEINNNHL